MNRRPWSQSEVAALRNLYEAGKAEVEIARVLERSQGAVSNARQARGVLRPPRQYAKCRPWSPAELRCAREFYARGASRDEMSAAFERSGTAIKRLVTDHALERDWSFILDPAQFNSPEEQWRRSPLAPRYAISSLGRVISLNPGKIGTVMAQWIDKDGYSHVTLQIGPRSKRFAVHRLVASAFISMPPSPSHQAAHRDGVPSNNAAVNLRWATPTENQSDRRVHGTAQRRADGRFLPAEKAGVRVIRVDW